MDERRLILVDCFFFFLRKNIEKSIMSIQKTRTISFQERNNRVNVIVSFCDIGVKPSSG